MSVIYTPPEPHHHEWPEGNNRPGTIAQCATCRAYAEKRESVLRPEVSAWHVLGLGEIVWARLAGKIPMPSPH